jgi:hypothetical protein
LWNAIHFTSPNNSISSWVERCSGASGTRIGYWQSLTCCLYMEYYR